MLVCACLHACVYSHWSLFTTILKLSMYLSMHGLCVWKIFIIYCISRKTKNIQFFPICYTLVSVCTDTQIANMVTNHQPPWFRIIDTSSSFVYMWKWMDLMKNVWIVELLLWGIMRARAFASNAFIFLPGFVRSTSHTNRMCVFACVYLYKLEWPLYFVW